MHCQAEERNRQDPPRQGKHHSDLNGKSIPTLLFGNKIDLKQNFQVTVKEAQEFAKELQLPLVLGSAKLDQNVTEAFHELVRMLNYWGLSHEKGGKKKKGKKFFKK